MSYEERKIKRLERKKKQQRIRRILVISLFIYLILRSLPGTLAKNSKTILPKKHNLIDSIDVQGFLILNEVVFPTVEPIDTKKELEGKRIPAGFQVAKIDSLSDTSSMEDELKRIEKDIDILSKSENKLAEKDKEKIEEDQEQLIDKLKDEIHAGNYSDIDKIKEQIENKDAKVSKFTPTNTLIKQSLESLEARREELLNNINNNNIIYKSEMAGILSYKIDNYEKVYIPKELENYTYENLRLPENLDNESEKDFNGFKIIDNFEWYVALKIDNLDNMKEYSEGDSILLKFEDSSEEVPGRVIKINKSKENMSIIVRVTTSLGKYYDERFPQVSIIMEKQNVYKLPTRALVSRDDQVGVYIKEFNGIVRFRPLSIVEKDKEYTYVSIGDDKGLIEVEGSTEPVKTITSYDEILMNSFNIKEGQVLD